MDDLGIIISCHKADYLLAKACCASIRFFLGDIPVCLIIDGNFTPGSLVKTYGVEFIDISTTNDTFLKDNSRYFRKHFGRMISFWKSPWKHFLYLDADTLVWGNVLKYKHYYSDFDLIVPASHEEVFTPEEIDSYFFKTKKIERVLPAFDWRKFKPDYFCSGVFFGKRDSLNFEDYKEAFELKKDHPGLFSHNDQGILNFLFFKLADEGKIRIKKLSGELPHVTVPSYGRDELSQKFVIGEDGPVYSGEDAVIHWCGPAKPHLGNERIFSGPSRYFRHKFLEDLYGCDGTVLDFIIRAEDMGSIITKRLSRLKNRILRLAKAL